MIRAYRRYKAPREAVQRSSFWRRDTAERANGRNAHVRDGRHDVDCVLRLVLFGLRDWAQAMVLAYDTRLVTPISDT